MNEKYTSAMDAIKQPIPALERRVPKKINAINIGNFRMPTKTVR